MWRRCWVVMVVRGRDERRETQHSLWRQLAAAGGVLGPGGRDGKGGGGGERGGGHINISMGLNSLTVTFQALNRPPSVTSPNTSCCNTMVVIVVVVLLCGLEWW